MVAYNGPRWWVGWRCRSDQVVCIVVAAVTVTTWLGGLVWPWQGWELMDKIGMGGDIIGQGGGHCFGVVPVGVCMPY